MLLATQSRTLRRDCSTVKAPSKTRKAAIVPKSMCAEFQVAAVAVAGGVAGQRCGMVLDRRSWTSDGDSAKRKRARKMAKVEMCWKCVSLPADEFSGRSCLCERCCWWSANPGRWQAAAPRASGDSGGRARPMTQQLTEQRYCPFWALMRRWLYLGECSSVRVESRLVLELFSARQRRVT